MNPRVAGEFLAVANRAADAAAGVTLAHFRTPHAVDNKASGGGFDPVTAADREAEQAIRAVIGKSLPDHGIVGEEAAAKGSAGAFTWVIDPIDGTGAFIAGVPLWTTLIALEEDHRPVVGLIDQPWLGERFQAAPGGATLASRGGARELRTSGCTALAEARLGTTSPSLFADGPERRSFAAVEARARLTRYGGDGYFYALLAAGHLDLVVEAGLQPYDVAALVPVIAGAGGVITTWDGGPANQGGRVVAAATGELHAAALAILGDT